MRAEQIDIAAHDHVLVARHRQALAGIERGDGAGQQETVAALAEQFVLGLELEIARVRVPVEHVAVAAVADQPAVGLDLGYLGVAVMQALHETAHQRILPGRPIRVGLVVNLVLAPCKAQLVEHAELLLRAQHALAGRHVGHAQGAAEQGIRLGYGHVAPHSLAVAVVEAAGQRVVSTAVLARLALHKGQAQVTGIGVEPGRPVEAPVAQVGQHLVLLRQRELGKRGGGRRCGYIAPAHVGHQVVARRTFGESDAYLLLARLQIRVRVVEHLLAVQAVALRLRHQGALRHAQALEACERIGGRTRATPVDAAVVHLATGVEAGDHLLARCRRGLVVAGTLEHLVTQRTRHHILLRRAERGKTGIRRRRAGRAPVDVVVLVVGNLALGEVGDDALAGRRVVVGKVVAGNGRAEAERGRHCLLLRWRKLLERGVGVGHGQVAPIHRGHVVLGEIPQVLGRIDLLVDGQCAQGRVGGRCAVLGAPGRVGIEVVQAKGVAQVVQRGRVGDVAARELVDRLDAVAQLQGHRIFLRSAQTRKRGAGGGGSHAGQRPVDLRVAVIGRFALEEAGAQWRTSLEVLRAAEHGIALRGGNGGLVRSGQGGRQQVLDEGVAGRVVETPIGVHRIAQRLGDGRARRGRQLAEGLVVGHRRDRDRIAQLQALGREQVFGRLRQRTGLQLGKDGGVECQRADGLAVDGVEVVGVVVNRVAVGQRHATGCGDAAGQAHFACGGHGQVGVVAGLEGHRRAVHVDEICPHRNGGAVVDMQVGARAQGYRLVVFARGHHRALQQQKAGAGMDRDAGAAAVHHQRGGVDHRVRGVDDDLAAGVVGADIAAAVGRDAIDLGAVAHHGANAG